MTAQQTTTPADNGVNVEALLNAREALEGAPEAAQFKWRASCEWINGTHSRSTVDGYFGLGAEHTRQQAFTFDADTIALYVDGELVAYDRVSYKPYWRTSTAGRGKSPYRFGLDEDGDLAVFDNSRQMIWSKTLSEDEKKGSFRIEDDGDL